MRSGFVLLLYRESEARGLIKDDPKVWFPLALLVIAFSVGIAGAFGSSQSHKTALGRPKLGFATYNTYGELVTAKPVCSETKGAHRSFYIHGSGFKPYGRAEYFVLYPNGTQYTFIKDPLVNVDENGRFTTDVPWRCWYGPRGTMDPLGVYRIFGVDLSAVRTTTVRSFTVSR